MIITVGKIEVVAKGAWQKFMKMANISVSLEAKSRVVDQGTTIQLVPAEEIKKR